MKKLIRKVKNWVLARNYPPFERMKQFSIRMPMFILFFMQIIVVIISLAFNEVTPTKPIRFLGSLASFILPFVALLVMYYFISKGKEKAAAMLMILLFYAIAVITESFFPEMARAQLAYIPIQMFFTAIFFDRKTYFQLAFMNIVTFTMIGIGRGTPSDISIYFTVSTLSSIMSYSIVSLVSLLSSTLEIAETNRNIINKEKERLDLIIDNMVDAIIVIDKDYNIILINSTAMELLGIFGSEIRGASILNLLKFQHSLNKSDPNIFERVIRNGEIVKLPFVYDSIDKDGNRKPALVTGSPIRNPQGVITFAAITVRDASVERELDKSKSEFISIASHQLRTPMTAAKWNLEIFNEDPPEMNDDQLNAIKSIEEGILRSVNFIEDLLQASRLDKQNKMNLQILPLDLGTMFNEIIAELKHLLTEKNITLQIEMPVAISINGDKNRLREAFENLLNNAIRYSRPNGVVTLSVTRSNEEVVIEISDQGIGIPTEEQTKLFKKFYRASNAQKVVTYGTGIGLYVVKEIIQAHKGTISFTSVENRGTTFIVRLPV